MAIAQKLDLLGRELELFVPIVDNHEIVSGPIHLRKSQHHRSLT
jgi:hypothetical protein